MLCIPAGRDMPVDGRAGIWIPKAFAGVWGSGVPVFRRNRLRVSLPQCQVLITHDMLFLNVFNLTPPPGLGQCSWSPPSSEFDLFSKVIRGARMADMLA